MSSNPYTEVNIHKHRHLWADPESHGHCLLSLVLFFHCCPFYLSRLLIFVFLFCILNEAKPHTHARPHANNATHTHIHPYTHTHTRAHIDMVNEKKTRRDKCRLHPNVPSALSPSTTSTSSPAACQVNTLLRPLP